LTTEQRRTAASNDARRDNPQGIQDVRSDATVA
jgi:hypothetical protein